MGKNRIFAVVLTAVLMLTCTTGWGTTYYVDPDGSDAANGLSWPTAFETIQKGVDVAVSGDVVEVNVGTYEETVDFDGNSITLTSTDPNDWDVVAATIIDADNASLDVVTFDSGEDANTLLTGFTLTGGDRGVSCSSVNPTISKCIIRNNGYGIGATGSGGPVITNNKIYDSTNAGISYSYSSPVSITIKNNLIYDNGDDGIFGYFGGATIRNNTIVGNGGDGIGHGGPAGKTISNCIIWDNGDDLDNCSATYSCIKDPNDASGTGNITGDANDPCFVDEPNDNFHLSLNSPCIDAGASGSYTGELDIDNQNRKNDTTVDMGADELYRVHNIDRELWYFTIQAALDDANAGYGDTIVVYPGTYYETVDFNGLSCTLTGSDPNDWDVVAATIIDANNASLDVVTFDSSSDANTLLTGLTLTGGDEGVHLSGFGCKPTIKRCIIEDCVTGIKTSSGTPLVVNNIIRDNSDDGISFSYGGTAPINIKNNLVYNNSDDGISIFFGGGIIRNNTVVGNGDKGIGHGGPGGIAISNCIVWGNGTQLSGCSATYSCIEGGGGGTGNISSDPCFVETIYYHIDENSLCIDAGDTSPDYSGELDIDGGVRVQDGDGDGNSIVDMGADEYDVAPVAVLVAEPNSLAWVESTILNGSGSSDSIGSIIKYEWDFENDGTYDYNETSGSAGDGAFDGNTPHTYPCAGVYTAKLRVSDDCGYTVTDTCIVTVSGATFYVDPCGSDDANGLSWATAFATIQTGIDEAYGGEPNSYDTIDINTGTYTTGPIIVTNSNLHFVFEPNVEVVAMSNNYDPNYDPNDPNNPFRVDPCAPSAGDDLLKIHKVSNIILDGNDTVFRMKKSEYETEPFPGYSRHIISLWNTSNIELRGLHLEDSRGSGVFVGHYTISKNVLIEDVNCDNNTMNAISVGGADGLIIQNCILQNCSGAGPQAGIDFEPSFDFQELKNIILRDTEIVDNNGGGICIYLPNYGCNNDVNIVIEDVNVVGGKMGTHIVLSDDGPDGSVIFKNVTIEDANRRGSIFFTSYKGVDFTFENCIWKNIGWELWRYPIMICPADPPHPYNVSYPGGIEFINCQVYDDKNRPAIKFSNLEVVGDLDDLYEIHGDLHVINPNRPGDLYDWSDANLYNVDITVHRGLADFIRDDDPNFNDVNDLQVWDFYMLDSNSNGYHCSKKFIRATTNLDANHCQTDSDVNIPHLHFESDFNSAEITAANRFWDWYFDVNSGVVRESNATNTKDSLAYMMDGYAGGANYDYWIAVCEDSNKIFTEDCNKDNSSRPPTVAEVNDVIVYEGYLGRYRLVAIVDSVDGNEPSSIRFKCGYSGVYSYIYDVSDDHFAVPGRDDLLLPVGDCPTGTWYQDHWDSNDADVYYSN